MRWILLGAVLVLGGCVTTSASKSEYQAEIAELKAQNLALQNQVQTRAAVHAAVSESKQTIMQEIKLMLELWMAERRPHAVSGNH